MFVMTPNWELTKKQAEEQEEKHTNWKKKKGRRQNEKLKTY